MIKIAICDDAQKDLRKAYNVVSTCMERLKEKYEISTFSSGIDLLKSIKEFDILFLDIQMEEMDGIKLGAFLSRDSETWIIFVTNYKEYCMQVLNKIHPYAFLVKPLDYQSVETQLISIMEKIKKKEAKKKICFDVILITKDCEIRKEKREFIIDEIYYFEYINNKIRICLEGSEYFMIGRLKDIEVQMEEYGYAKCHQTYVVNIKHTIRVHNYKLFLKNGECLPVSQRKSAVFRGKMNHYIQ